MSWHEKVYTTHNYTSVPKGVWKRILQREGHACASCFGRKELNPHHIKPQAKGGDHTEENLVVLCLTCHDAIEALGLTRLEIQNWADQAPPDPKPPAQDWHAWVYGGCRPAD